MELDVHATLLAICRLPPDDCVPGWVTLVSQPLVSITRTYSELSIVLPQADLPPGIPAETGWRAMSVRGPLPFAVTGILASLSAALAEAAVPVFAICTYDTDWLLIKDTELGAATAALQDAGHGVHHGSEPANEATVVRTGPRQDLPMTRNSAYRYAVAVAVGTGLFLLWGMGALGIIGVEGDPADRMFYGVLAVAIGGAIVARFRPPGMVRAMLVTAGATLLVGVLAVLLGEHRVPDTSIPEILGLTGMFATLWAGSAFLFRKASSP